MIIGSKVKLCHKRLSDAPNDYAWQNDSELASLDAMPRLTMPYHQYLLIYARQLCRSSSGRRQFAVDTMDGKHIGNCVYYGIDKFSGEAELGIMIGNRDYWDKGYGTDVVAILVNHIFSQTELRRIHLKTLESNGRAQKCFQKCGFVPCGYLCKDGFRFVLMEIYRKHWSGQIQLSRDEAITERVNIRR